MHNEFTAVFERDGDWYVAYSPEIPGANGQGRTKEEARQSLAEAIALILADRREDGLRGVPPDAERETVIVRGNDTACCSTFGATAATSREKAGRIRSGSTLPPALLKRPPPYGNCEQPRAENLPDLVGAGTRPRVGRVSALSLVPCRRPLPSPLHEQIHAASSNCRNPSRS